MKNSNLSARATAFVAAYNELCKQHGVELEAEYGYSLRVVEVVPHMHEAAMENINNSLDWLRMD